VLLICRDAKCQRGGQSALSGMVVHLAAVRTKAAVGAQAAAVVLGCVSATSVLVSVVVVDVPSFSPGFSPSRCGLCSAATNVGSCIVDNGLI
jgi:hypothetical protein